jgi:hypothetical protein
MTTFWDLVSSDTEYNGQKYEDSPKNWREVARERVGLL